jgi:signal transduction histidine kinase
VTVEEKEEELLSCGDYVRISIKDCGKGISSENIQQVFDPFFTTDMHLYI